MLDSSVERWAENGKGEREEVGWAPGNAQGDGGWWMYDDAV